MWCMIDRVCVVEWNESVRDQQFASLNVCEICGCKQESLKLVNLSIYD